MGVEWLVVETCQKYIYTPAQDSRKLGTSETVTRALGAMVLERARLRSISLCRASSVKGVSRINTVRTKVTFLCVSGIFNYCGEDNRGISSICH
jgi:hypothetical protein